MATREKIKVRLRSYEHSIIDSAAAKIVDIAKRNGAEVSGSGRSAGRAFPSVRLFSRRSLFSRRNRKP